MKLTQEQKIRIRKHLMRLGKCELLIADPECGICDELLHVFPEFVDDIPLFFYFESWDKFSGDFKYPIKGFPSSSPRETYIITSDKWADDEYGDLRRDLCLHIAEEMKKEINEEKGHAWLRICIR